MSSTVYPDSAAAPGTRTKDASSNSDSEKMRNIIGLLARSLGSIDRIFETLDKETATLSSLGPTTDEITRDIEVLHRKVRQHNKAQDHRIKEIKNTMNNLKGDVSDLIKEQIREQIRLEVADQVKKEVDEQIQEHIPVSLQQQTVDNEKRLLELRVSLANSESRMRNAGQSMCFPHEPLAPILKADGNKSRMFPADLRSLFCYNCEQTRMLLGDYGLAATEDAETNIRLFVEHIGVESVPRPCLKSQMANDESPLARVHHAYRKLTRSELVLFLKVRNLPTSGSEVDLASRLAHHDLHTYHLTNSPDDHQSSYAPTRYQQKTRPVADLPVEILADIMDHLGDWELAKAVGVPTALPRPLEWARASRMDEAMLSGRLPAVRAVDPAVIPPTKIGAVLAIRFGYVNILEYFLSQHHSIFLSIFKGDLIPIKASRHGRIAVLAWWKHGFEQHPHLISPPKTGSISEAIDGASRNGQVASLDWWLNCGHSLEYTEAALEYASAKNQIAVLEWWKQQNKLRGIPLKIGRVMDMASTAGHVQVLEWWATSQLEFKYDRHALQHASCHGKVEVLEWWLGSGLQLIFDQEALTGATRHNRPEVLQWWDKSGLPIQYRMCDIEEALEDAIGGGDDARKWWQQKGVDFNANDKEWMKLQSLN